MCNWCFCCSHIEVLGDNCNIWTTYKDKLCVNHVFVRLFNLEKLHSDTIVIAIAPFCTDMRKIYHFARHIGSHILLSGCYCYLNWTWKDKLGETNAFSGLFNHENPHFDTKIISIAPLCTEIWSIYHLGRHIGGHIGFSGN